MAIFGRPHAGNIGFGKLYAEGYEGPDLTLYNYIAATDANKVQSPIPDDLFENVRKEFKPGGAKAITDADDEKGFLKDLRSVTNFNFSWF